MLLEYILTVHKYVQSKHVSISTKVLEPGLGERTGIGPKREVDREEERMREHKKSEGINSVHFSLMSGWFRVNQALVWDYLL
jgi:hypothetical protein